MNNILKYINIDKVKLSINFDNGIDTIIKSAKLDKDIKKFREEMGWVKNFSIFHPFMVNNHELSTGTQIKNDRYDKIVIYAPKECADYFEIVYEINGEIERVNLNNLILVKTLNEEFKRKKNLLNYSLGEYDNLNIKLYKEFDKISLLIELKEEYYNKG